MLTKGRNVKLCVCSILLFAVILVSTIVVYFKFFAVFVDKGLLVPVVINTWNMTSPNDKGWAVISTKGHAIRAVELGIGQCEIEQCRHTVGFGGSPDEHGETTLDALIVDGTTMNVGAVAALREIKAAISVATFVMNSTNHSLLVGSQATEFAEMMGFQRVSLTTNYSAKLHHEWKENQCQPNYWQHVIPDPKLSCGPYHARSRLLDRKQRSTGSGESSRLKSGSGSGLEVNEDNHDTIGLIAVDHDGNVVAGTSTNGLKNKIPGRVGDSPIPGSGAYAETGVGAAVATGNGDIMMRFAPTAIAVEHLRNGKSARSAAKAAVARIARFYPDFDGAVIVATPYGDYGAACNGWESFPYVVHARGFNTTLKTIKCHKRGLGRK